MPSKKFLNPINLVNLASDPPSATEGDIYYNTTADAVKVYANSVWVAIGSGGGAITVSTTEPASPETGDAWYKNNTGEFYVYDGTYWVEVNGVIEGLTQEQVQDYVAPLFTNATNTNVIATYDDANNVVNLNTSGSLVSINSITYPDFITFDITPEIIPTEQGSIYWDSEDAGLRVVANDTSVLIGQEQYASVKNSTGSTISKGKVVYINGAQGQKPTVTFADADTELTSSKTFGFAAEDIIDGAEGIVVTEGILRGINTLGFTQGGEIYLSGTAGEFTQTKPTAPVNLVFLGYVVKAHASSGEVYVKIQNGYELEELHDVLISASVQNGESLVWNSASNLWMNQLISGGGATTTVSETAPASAELGDTWYKQSDGSFFIYDGTYWVEVTNTITMTDEQAQDKVSSLFVHSNHSNLTATYDDANNQIIMSTSASVSSEQVQDLIAPLFTHANHTNITATYDDGNNQILLSASGGVNIDTTTISSASATTINTISSSTYRSAEIIVQIVQGSKQTISKILMIHDGTTANITEYGLIELGASRIPVTISATLTGGNVLIQATITDANVTSATVKVLATTIPI